MKRTLIAALAAAAATSAFAVEEPVIVLKPKHHEFTWLAASDFGKDQADAWKRWADDFSREMRSSVGAMFAPRAMSSKVVKGAPYSAQLVTETIQSLSDGNTISRKKTGAVYRDAEGRTRQETATDGKESTIYISDPVEGKTYVLSPGAKKAVVLPRPPEVPALPGHAPAAKHTHDHKHKHVHVVRTDGTEVRVEDGRVFIDGREVPSGHAELASRSGKKIVVDNGRVTIDGRELSVPTPPAAPRAPGQNVIVKRIDTGDGTHREEVRVHVIRSDGEAHAPMPPVPPTPAVPGVAPVPPVPPVPPMPGVNTFRFESPSRLGKGVTTELGVKEFDGVKAEGKQTTWTIPAGQIGNAKPISIVSERWYSPELQVTVYSRYNDPRTGETIYRLQAIRRGEPGPDLFRVPEDYKTRERNAPRARG
jgi:hypothetical protein